MPTRRPSRLIVTLALLAAVAPAARATPLGDGDTAYKAHDYTTALADYQQAAAAGGADKAKALYKEGLALHHLGRDPDAVTAYNQAQAADPSLAFASSAATFTHNLQVAQAGAGGNSPSTDPAAVALASQSVYVAPELAGQASAAALGRAASASHVKIAVLDRLPAEYNSVNVYTQHLHDYLGLGTDGLIVTAAHGTGRGVADLYGSNNHADETAIAQKYVAQIGSGDYNGGLAAMAQDVGSNARGIRPALGDGPRSHVSGFLIGLLVVAVIVAVVIVARSGRRRATY